MTTKKQAETRYTTPKGRLSFPFLTEPRQPDEPGKKPMYEVSLIFDKAAQATPEYKALKDAVLAAAKAEWPKVPLDKIAFPFKKGDDKTNSNGERMDGYDDGTVYVSAKSPSKPTMFDSNGEQISSDTFYGGCIVKARVAVYSYDYQKMKKGVSLGLRGVQFIEDGERFGGGGTATAEEFGAVQAGPNDPGTPDVDDLPF